MTINDYEIKDCILGFNRTELPYNFYQPYLTFRGEQYPAYHRMDIRTNRNFNLEKGRIAAFVHLVNVYNRENLRKFDLDARDDNDNLQIDDEGNYIPFRDDKTWFGFLPVLGLVWEFSN